VRVEAVDACGVRVLEVLAGSPASKTTLQKDDVIVAIDGTAITGINQARTLVQSKEAGTTLRLTVQRNGAELNIDVVLGTQPTTLPATVSAGGTPAATPAATTSAGGSTSGATPAATGTAAQ
jgi:S1-C subfamily serine protease